MQKAGCSKQIHSQTLRGDFFRVSFSFLSPDRLIFLVSVGRLLVVVSLRSTTLQSTLSWGSIQQLSHSLLSVSLTGLHCAEAWKLINCVCLSQPFVFGVSLFAVCTANIFLTPYQDRSLMYAECFKATNVIASMRLFYFSFDVLRSPQHPFKMDWTSESLNSKPTIMQEE